MSGRRTVLRVEDLHALIDGQLAPERRAIVESDLKADPDAQRLVSQLIADRDALRTALAPIQDEPIPQRLRVANVERDRRRHNRWLAVQAVAAALLLSAGGGAGWLAHEAARRNSIVLDQHGRWGSIAEDAIRAHNTFSVETRHPVEVFGDTNDQLTNWIAKRLGRRLPPPDLSPLGFALLGGRILPSPLGTAALLMYQAQNGERITLYLKPGEAGETAIRSLTSGGTQVMYWVDDGCAYVITGTLDRSRMEALSGRVFEHFEGNPGAG